MLPTLIQRYDKNHFNFNPVQDTIKIISILIKFKNERLTEILQAVRCHIYDRINTIYQFIKPFLDTKCHFFRKMEPLTT